MPIDDGMPDLGNLPSRTLAVRNKITGVVMTPESLAVGTLDPSQEDPWSRHVRYAYTHQDQLELLTFDPTKGTLNPLKDREDTGAVPTLKDGRPLTQETLEGLHFQTLRAQAKSLNVPLDGRTRLQITEGILQAAYAEAGLPIPQGLPPKE